ncbi:hypothetical protein IFM89_022968 [Coptis chinensis]|uniref:FBD domain-containing protein n=1 Tax=Coptis chinensis TaxID=261450 RepID=A0A835LEY2_9MAGN|nr:hypothetical protein IFM89_022968 [Coptis chinensis]
MMCCYLGHPISLFHMKIQCFGRQDISDSVSHHLRRLDIRGFKGSELEMAFTKYVLIAGTSMEKITIEWHCSEIEESSATLLRLLPKTSMHVSIELKPGPVAET